MSDKGKNIFKAIVFFLFALLCLIPLFIDISGNKTAFSLFGTVLFLAIGTAYLRQAFKG